MRPRRRRPFLHSCRGPYHNIIVVSAITESCSVPLSILWLSTLFSTDNIIYTMVSCSIFFFFFSLELRGTWWPSSETAPSAGYHAPSVSPHPQPPTTSPPQTHKFQLNKARPRKGMKNGDQSCIRIHYSLYIIIILLYVYIII